MRVTSTPLRWALCFVILPAVWFARPRGGPSPDAVLLHPSAVVPAFPSGLTAYRSGRGNVAAAGYFRGTAVMMGLTVLAVSVTIHCDRGQPCRHDGGKRCSRRSTSRRGRSGSPYRAAQGVHRRFPGPRESSAG